MTDKQIQVWITSSPDVDFLQSLRPKINRNDIVLLYSQQTKSLSLIGGYRLQDFSLPHQFLHPVGRQEIKARVTRFFPADNYVLKLQANEWARLRDFIITTNPQLSSVIERLEGRQLNSPTLSNDAAIIFDVLFTPIQIFFGHQDITPFRTVFNDWRTDLLDSSNSTLGVIRYMKEEKLAYSAPNRLDPFHQAFSALIKKNYHEEDSIGYDYDHAGIGLEKQPGIFEPMVEQAMCLVKDTATGRKLFLYAAHRRGYRQSDLLNADIIYESTINKSVVLIQYKHLQANNSIRFKGDNQVQLDGLLSICGRHDCAHQKGNSGQYMPTDEMRVRDCPVYYKLLNHRPTISPERKTMDGIYIPACFLHQMTIEKEEAIRRQPDLDRGLRVNTFFELLRASQIGCKAQAFVSIKQLMLHHMGEVLNANKDNNSILVHASEQPLST